MSGFCLLPYQKQRHPPLLKLPHEGDYQPHKSRLILPWLPRDWSTYTGDLPLVIVAPLYFLTLIFSLHTCLGNDANLESPDWHFLNLGSYNTWKSDSNKTIDHTNTIYLIPFDCTCNLVVGQPPSTLVLINISAEHWGHQICDRSSSNRIPLLNKSSHYLSQSNYYVVHLSMDNGRMVL